MEFSLNIWMKKKSTHQKARQKKRLSTENFSVTLPPKVDLPLLFLEKNGGIFFKPKTVAHPHKVGP